MKKRIWKIVLAVALVMAAVLAWHATPASAHNQDNYSFWYCGLTRTSPSQTVYHSSPVALFPGVVRYYCYANSPQDYDYQWWVDVSVVSGDWHTPFYYQNCDIIDCSVTARSYGH